MQQALAERTESRKAEIAQDADQSERYYRSLIASELRVVHLEEKNENLRNRIDDLIKEVARLQGEPRLPASIRLLFIDDEKFLHEAVTQNLMLLAGDHLHIQCASTLAEGLSLVSRFRPNLVLLDLKLPCVDGEVEAVERMRDAFPDLPIIAISGSHDLGLKATVAGANAFVTKPPKYKELLFLIESLRMG